MVGALHGELLLVQLLATITLALIVINTTPLATILLGALYITAVSLLITLSGFYVSAVFLVLAEIHVLYAVLCLALGWIRIDTLSASTAVSSKALNSGSIASLIALAAVVSGPAMSSASASIFSCESYIHSLLIDASLEYGAVAAAASSSILFTVAGAFLGSLLLEFVLANILMFLATTVFFALGAALKRDVVGMLELSAKELAGIFRRVTTPDRDQSLSEQHAEDGSVRCLAKLARAGNVLSGKTKKLNGAACYKN